MKTKFMTFAMMMAMLGITSCSKTDLYDEGQIAEREAAEAAARQAKLIEDYKAHFIKTYGEIDSNQSWDFSTNHATFYANASSRATRGLGVEPSTTGSGQATVSNAYYEVQQNTRSLMHTVFVEGHNNTTFMQDTYFGLYVPDQDDTSFTILPVFMGRSGGNFELHLQIVGGQNLLIWSKWDGIQYKTANSTGWETLSSSHNEGGYNLVNATAIKAKPITITGLPRGAEMYFYLKITEAAPGYNTKGQELSCVDGYVKEYAFNASDINLNDLPGVADPDNVKCKFFGCEDASTSKTDKDFNDVVFLCYGNVPESYKVTKISRETPKRYMIEDLGLSDDKDFNDIVVDVIFKETATILTQQDGVTPAPGYDNPNWEDAGYRAEIRALGGTLDFELKIGNATWRKSLKTKDYTQMLNTSNPSNKLEPIDVIEDITGYTHDGKNVSVKVFQKDGELEVYFPETGTVPMMIATDASVLWSKERVKFPFESYE